MWHAYRGQGTVSKSHNDMLPDRMSSELYSADHLLTVSMSHDGLCAATALPNKKRSDPTVPLHCTIALYHGSTMYTSSNTSSSVKYTICKTVPCYRSLRHRTHTL